VVAERFVGAPRTLRLCEILASAAGLKEAACL
jgi:hypothetical protein